MRAQSKHPQYWAAWRLMTTLCCEAAPTAPKPPQQAGQPAQAAQGRRLNFEKSGARFSTYASWPCMALINLFMIKADSLLLQQGPAGKACWALSIGAPRPRLHRSTQLRAAKHGCGNKARSV